ncbi:nuclear transcription factor Y subunit A-1-like isoform X2 [Vicia villosa]|uniref:nuclear transcription factor Y subunit A-1-like isoform X2 n=1 Tax=Vicia villosa TaxID=3911 RepID=UPI00273B3CB0|nr:nuclear transcription factor Y subunit A-1-like isoform X2 [Vicia villosa]
MLIIHCLLHRKREKGSHLNAILILKAKVPNSWKTSERMPGKPETDECGVKHSEHVSIYSHHPWWLENASKSSSLDQLNCSIMNLEALVSPSGGDVAKEHRNIKHYQSSTPFTMDKHLDPNSQTELVGHSTVLTSPYSHPQFGQFLTTYGQPAMMNPQLYHMHHTRVLLPLEMEEEPVYVNAKQYHGILRRRQSRAKAELEKKVIKVRKPYLHESRHLHALRRARGNGGRFLNTKKLEHDSNAAIEKGNDTGAMLVTNKENQGSSNALPSVQKLQGFDIGYHDGNGFTGVCHSQANGKQEGDFFGKERDSSGAIK